MIAPPLPPVPPTSRPARAHHAAEANRSSLRFQILGRVGAAIILLMGISSLAVLHEARTHIIAQQTQRAVAAAGAFGIAVVDAFIVGDQIHSVGGDLLENHIRRFSSDVDDVLYISIVDPTGRIIAHSDPRLYNAQLDTTAARVSRTTVPLTAMFRDPSRRWVVEAVVPLQVGNHRWGSAFLGFDAEPTRRQVGRLFVLLFGLTLAATGITLAVVYYFIDRLTAALRLLVTEVDKIDFESATPMSVPAPNNEIGFLIHHFELLQNRLVQSRADLAAAERQVYHAEKLASVGRLAAGVAHEVNNPLNGIRFCLHGLRQVPADPDQVERYTGLIDEGIAHIEAVVQKLLGFARHRPAEFGEICLNEQIQRVLELLGFQLREKEVVTQLALADDLPAIRADANLVQEMLMNLLLNGIDAVDPGGTIRVRTATVPAGGVLVSVTDDGVGIQQEHLQSIFEPFFTTKDPGRGTGLGLAVTLGIVERHGGTIRVHSVPGKRTTFSVTLPTGAAS